jgi:hypothetical protein
MPRWTRWTAGVTLVLIGAAFLLYVPLYAAAIATDSSADLVSGFDLPLQTAVPAAALALLIACTALTLAALHLPVPVHPHLESRNCALLR